MLAVKMNAAADASAAEEAARVQSAEDKKLKAQYEQEWRDATSRSAPAQKPGRTQTRTPRKQPNVIADALGSRAGQTVVREVLRGIFSTLKRR
jgi:hypothetical protein